MRHILTSFLLGWCLFCTLVGYAQDPRRVDYGGQVLDAKHHEPICHAIVLLLSKENDASGLERKVSFATTDSRGYFRINLPSSKRVDLIEVRLMGYKIQRLPITSASEKMIIYLEEDPEELPEVVVLSTPITSSGDTITYRASAFITKETYSAEDLISRLPGITVDTRGIISYLGDPITGVYIEGLDLVADSYQTATRIVKAEDISAVDVMERFQKKRVLRGIEEGEGTMLNIRFKDNKMLAPSGEVMLAGGASAKEKLLHSLGANTLLVNHRTQILGMGTWDSSTVQDSEPIGVRRSIPNTSALSLVGNKLTSHADESQALSQTNALGTLNQIFVLKEEVTAKYNVGFSHKKSSSMRGKEGYLAHEEGFVHFVDQYTNQIEGNLAHLRLNYTENSSRRYLLNTLTIEGDWKNGTHNILRGESITEHAQSKEFRLSEDFNLATRSGDNTMTFDGTVNFRKLPNTSFQVPTGSYAYHQTIDGSDLSAYTRASYGWGLGGLYSLWGTIELEGHLEDIGLSSENLQDERTVQGGRLQVSSAPTLSYNAPRLKWSVSVPLQWSWLSYRFRDLADNPQRVERGKLSPGLSAKMSFRPSPLWYISWNGRYAKQNLSQVTDYFLGSYHQTFDQVLSRSEVMEPERNTLSALLNIEYRQPLKALFGRARVTAIRTTDNRLISRTLEGTAKWNTKTTGKQTRDFVGGEFYLSKQFPALKSVISISTEYAYSSFPMIIDTHLYKLSSQIFGGRMGLTSTPLRWLEVSTTISQNTTRNRSRFGAFTFTDWYARGRITCSFLKKWSASVLGTYTAIGESGGERYQSFTLLSGNITYRQPRFRIELKADNMLNTPGIYQYSVEDADRYASFFALRPRQILLSTYIKF